MLDPTGLTTIQIKQRRKKILEEFQDEINGYAKDLLRTLSSRNLKKNDLQALQKEIKLLEEMREVFFSEVKILNKRKKQPLKNSGFLGFSFKRSARA